MFESDPSSKEEKVKAVERNIESLIIASEITRQCNLPLSKSFVESFFKAAQKYLV